MKTDKEIFDDVYAIGETSQVAAAAGYLKTCAYVKKIQNEAFEEGKKHVPFPGPGKMVLMGSDEIEPWPEPDNDLTLTLFFAGCITLIVVVMWMVYGLCAVDHMMSVINITPAGDPNVSLAAAIQQVLNQK